MQSQVQQEIELPIDHSYSSSEISLLGSRHRLKCQPSESQSQVEVDAEQQMQEFKQQIEERYRRSIANKIYTFPRRMKSMVELCSSSEDQTAEHLGGKETDSSRRPTNLTHLKKKIIINAPSKSAIHNASTLRIQYESQIKGLERGKFKGNSKKKRSKGKPVSRGSAGVSKGKGVKKVRQRTEVEYSSSYLETVKAKMPKKD